MWRHRPTVRIRVLVRAKVGNDLFYALRSKRFSIKPQELTNDTLSVPKMFAHAQLPPTVLCCLSMLLLLFLLLLMILLLLLSLLLSWQASSDDYSLSALATLSIYVHCWRFGIFPLAKFGHFRHCCWCCCSYSCLANSHCFVGLPVFALASVVVCVISAGDLLAYKFQWNIFGQHLKSLLLRSPCLSFPRLVFLCVCFPVCISRGTLALALGHLCTKFPALNFCRCSFYRLWESPTLDSTLSSTRLKPSRVCFVASSTGVWNATHSFGWLCWLLFELCEDWWTCLIKKEANTGACHAVPYVCLPACEFMS